jgi:MraZ protein
VEYGAVFLGRHSHSLDEKGRLALPARFRERLNDGVVLTRGFDLCILVYPMASWLALAERVSALSLGDPDVRRLRRMIFADAVDAQLDRQGRVLVPADLRAYAGLDRETIIVGMHTFIEIWAPERWSAQREELDRDGAAFTARLAELI